MNAPVDVPSLLAVEDSNSIISKRSSSTEIENVEQKILLASDSAMNQCQTTRIPATEDSFRDQSEQHETATDVDVYQTLISNLSAQLSLLSTELVRSNEENASLRAQINVLKLLLKDRQPPTGRIRQRSSEEISSDPTDHRLSQSISQHRSQNQEHLLGMQGRRLEDEVSSSSEIMVASSLHDLLILEGSEETTARGDTLANRPIERILRMEAQQSSPMRASRTSQRLFLNNNHEQAHSRFSNMVAPHLMALKYQHQWRSMSTLSEEDSLLSCEEAHCPISGKARSGVIEAKQDSGSNEHETSSYSSIVSFNDGGSLQLGRYRLGCGEYKGVVCENEGQEFEPPAEIVVRFLM